MVDRLLTEGQSSLRLMALLSLQLAKVLVNNPAVLPLYIDAYLQLMLARAWPCDQPEALCQVGPQ